MKEPQAFTVSLFNTKDCTARMVWMGMSISGVTNVVPAGARSPAKTL